MRVTFVTVSVRPDAVEATPPVAANDDSRPVTITRLPTCSARSMARSATSRIPASRARGEAMSLPLARASTGDAPLPGSAVFAASDPSLLAGVPGEWAAAADVPRGLWCLRSARP